MIFVGAVLKEKMSGKQIFFPKSDLQLQLIGYIAACWSPRSTEQEYDARKCWNRSFRTRCSVHKWCATAAGHPRFWGGYSIVLCRWEPWNMVLPSEGVSTVPSVCGELAREGPTWINCMQQQRGPRTIKIPCFLSHCLVFLLNVLCG